MGNHPEKKKDYGAHTVTSVSNPLVRVGADGSQVQEHRKVFQLLSDENVIKARKWGRTIAAQAGFRLNDQVLIATAISEITRNVIDYAGKGEIEIEVISDGVSSCVKITVTDEGPGIVDLTKAMQDGYSTGKGLGVGLPGSRRIMDDFEITSSPGEGTKVVMKKYIRT